MRYRARSWWMAVLLGCGALGPACLVTSPGPSAVSRGDLYQSGETLYDEFFAELHAVQLAMGQAREDERAVRGKLAAALGVGTSSPAISAPPAGGADSAEVAPPEGEGGAPPSGPEAAAAAGDAAPPDALAAAVEARIAQVKWRTRMRLDIDGELGDEGASAKVTLDGKPRDSERDLAAVVEAAVNAELEVLARMRGHQQQLDRLASMADGLEKNVSNVFGRAGLAKRAEVKKNLRDAQALIPLMMGRVQEVSTAAERTVRKLRAAVSTLETPVAAPSAPAAPPSAKGAPAKGAPAKGAPPPRGTAPPPKGAPAPRPPASDFEP